MPATATRGGGGVAQEAEEWVTDTKRGAPRPQQHKQSQALHSQPGSHRAAGGQRGCGWGPSAPPGPGVWMRQPRRDHDLGRHCPLGEGGPQPLRDTHLLIR